MIIVIDGYNILRSFIHTPYISDHDRDQFLALLKQYTQRKKHKIIVVFDGGPYEWTHKEKQHGIQVVYSGRHETADDYIVHYLEQHQSSDLLLVSSDRELNVVASQYATPSIGSFTFYKLVQEALESRGEQVKATGKALKISEKEMPELDVLMQEASEQVPIKEEDTESAVKKEVRAKLSKKDRKLMAKLKKL